MRHAQPSPDQARRIKDALARQEAAKARLAAAEPSGPALLVAAAAEYLDATDALYQTQLDVPRNSPQEEKAAPLDVLHGISSDLADQIQMLEVGRRASALHSMREVERHLNNYLGVTRDTGRFGACRPFAEPPTHHHGSGARCDCGARPNFRTAR